MGKNKVKIEECVRWSKDTDELVMIVFMEYVNMSHKKRHPGANLAQTLAELTGKTPVAVYKWINKTTSMKLTDAVRISLYYDIDMSLVLDVVQIRQKEIDEMPF